MDLQSAAIFLDHSSFQGYFRFCSYEIIFFRMCAKGFKSKKCLLKHEAAHLTDLGMAGDPIAQDESQYRCRLCGKGFKSKKCHLKHEAQHLTDLGVAGDSRVPSTAQGQADGFFQVRHDAKDRLFFIICTLKRKA